MKPVTNKRIYVSIYIKFKNKQNYLILIEVDYLREGNNWMKYEGDF